jgi:molybdate/tungstate transport system substrate-binding protein
LAVVLRRRGFRAVNPTRAIRKILAVAGVALACAGGAAAQAPSIVSVLYAGSLVTPMEGPIKTALAADGVSFQGQGAGSRMLANLIASGAKNPDVFVSVDRSLVSGLGSKVASACTFAGTSLGVGWSDHSRFASALARAAAGKTPLLDVLTSSGIAIGRTDPRLDPKGQYTVEAMTLLAGTQRERQILGEAENQAQTFPEEDLLVRIETGQADVGFFYETEAVARGLNFMPLPGAAALTDKITYTLAVIAGAPHPREAAAFKSFILKGRGKAILQKAGLRYFDVPCARDVATISSSKRNEEDAVASRRT